MFFLVAWGPAGVAPESGLGSTRVEHEEPSRDFLIKDLWPDKALYAAVLLFITGFIGVINGLVRMVVDLDYSERVPALVSSYPETLTLALAVLALACGIVAMRKRRTTWTVVGAVLAITSIGFVGINLVLAFICLWFVYLSRKENEDGNPATQILTADMWPDKTLAASLLMLIGGMSALTWGAGILFDVVTYDGYFGPTWLFGLAAMVVGFASVTSSRELYYQRGRMFASGVAVLQVIFLAFWIIGPAVGIATLVLIQLARGEAEFEDESVPA